MWPHETTGYSNAVTAQHLRRRSKKKLPETANELLYVCHKKYSSLQQLVFFLDHLSDIFVKDPTVGNSAVPSSLPVAAPVH